ncbi:MAG: DUF3160 domain-containing protein, partial [Candidatus Zixiibacteriota bacterium]
MRRVTLIIFLMLAAAGCRSGEMLELEGLPDSPPLAYELDEVEYLGKDWTPEKLRYLREHGFVVTDKTYRQICTFYIRSERPTYITTDSALHAYFINLEESVYRLELVQAGKLRNLLGELRGRLAEERATRRPGAVDTVYLKAVQDLDCYLLVAEILLGMNGNGTIPKGTPPEVKREVKLILAAEGPAMSPTRKVRLDYSQFKPRGLYVKGYSLPEELGYGPENRTYVAGEYRGWRRDLPPPPNMEGGEPERIEDEESEPVYFERPAVGLPAFYRAVTWLHDVPFRASDESETMQALILAALDAAIGPEESPLAGFNSPYVEFMGPSDDAGIVDYRKVYLGHFGSFDRLASNVARRERAFAALRKLPPPRHATTPEVAAVADPAKYAGLRVVPRPTLYENEVFKTLSPYGKGGPPTSGEELFAVLGSTAAQEIVKGREARSVRGYGNLFREAVAAAEKAEKTYDTEICRKRRALYRTLLATPQDHELPAYYRHSAWRYKD